MRDFCCGLDFGGGTDPEGESSWGGPMCLSPKWQWFRNILTLYVKLGVDLQDQVEGDCKKKDERLIRSFRISKLNLIEYFAKVFPERGDVRLQS
jgi:hypothetical protein